MGSWETTNEGGFQIVMGSRLDLLENGTGTEWSWGSGPEEFYQASFLLNWERLDTTTILIKYEADTSFDTVTYVIEDYIGSYDIKYDKLYDPNYDGKRHGLEGFWVIPQELFRRK